MYLESASSVKSVTQIEDGKGRLGPKALVSQCAFQKVLKISVAKRNVEYPHARSFGELGDLSFLENL